MNIKLWLKMKNKEINEASYQYVIKHQLIEKYFYNYSNYNFYRSQKIVTPIMNLGGIINNLFF